MKSPSITYRLIGPGRAGRAIQSALSNTPWECIGTYNRADDITNAAEGVDAVVVAVPDDAIASVAEAVLPGDAVLIHLSGAKTLKVLAPHDQRASVHPLVSIPDPETGRTRLRSEATFAVAGHQFAADMVAVLGGRAIEVGDDNRVLYHAAAAIAANHLVVVCAQVSRIAGQLGLPPELYWDLMDSTLENVSRVGPLEALTGPASRGDEATVADHLAALATLDPNEVDLYRTLASEAARLGGQQSFMNQRQP